MVRPSDNVNSRLDALDRKALGALYGAALAPDARFERARLGACVTGALGILAAGETRRLLVDHYTKSFSAPLHRVWDNVESSVARGCARVWPGSSAAAQPASPAPAQESPAAAPARPRGPQLIGTGVVALPRVVTELSALAYLGVSDSAAVVVGITTGMVFGLLVATPVGLRLSDEHMRFVGEVLSVLRRAREMLARSPAPGAESHQAALMVLAAAMIAQLAQHVSSSTGQSLLNHVSALLAPVPEAPAPQPRPQRKGARRLLNVIAEDDELRLDAGAPEVSLDAALHKWMELARAQDASEAQTAEALRNVRYALERAQQPQQRAGMSTASSSRLASPSILQRVRSEPRPALNRTTSAPLNISRQFRSLPEISENQSL